MSNIVENLIRRYVESRVQKINLLIYKFFEKIFNCEVIFVFQPFISWCKDLTNEEKTLLDFTNKFDTNIADISLSFYDSSKLPHIKSEDIPNGVEKVKYEINIENLEKTDKHNTLSSNVLDSQNSL